MQPSSLSDFPSFFRIFTPEKIHLPCDFLDFFSVKQDTFLILKLLIKFFNELVIGQRSFLAICTGLKRDEDVFI